MRIKGRVKWVPPNILEELDSVKSEEKISRDCEAFGRIVEYAKVGREVKRMRDRFFMQDVFGNKK